MLRLRHALRLLREFVGFAVVNRVAWFIPLLVILFVVAAFTAAGGAVVPYTVYTLF